MRLLVILSILSVFSCDLQKVVEVDLPAYDTQPVVECYLEAGEPYRLLVTRSTAFFDNLPTATDSFAILQSIQELLINDATVSIEHNGERIILENRFVFENGKLFNYATDRLVDTNGGFELTISIPDIGDIEASTSTIQAISSDSTVLEKEGEFYRYKTYFTDPTPITNYYYRIFESSSTDDDGRTFDFYFSDAIFESETISFITDFDFVEGDTIYDELIHLQPDYFDFLNTVDGSISANFNPLGQGGAIKSNVAGSANPIGIFTFFAKSVDTVIVK